jgi:hypothetical protein
MKTSHSSKINPSIFKQDLGEQSIRVIKAAQASKLLNGAGNNGHTHNGTQAHKKPEIRMIHSGADYCDLEVVCGCGESTQVRCWNTAATAEKAAA